MAILFMEGFDGVSSAAELNQKHANKNNGITVSYNPLALTITSSQGVDGGNALSPTDDQENCFVVDLAGTYADTLNTNNLLVQFWVKFVGGYDTAAEPFVHFRNGTTSTSVFTTDTSGRFNFNGSVLNHTFLLNTYYFMTIELCAKTTGGYLEVNIPQSGFNYTLSGDTVLAGSDGITNISFNGPDGSNSAFLHYDDIVIMSQNGGGITDFTPFGKIPIIRPNAIGDDSDWTPTSGDNYTNVDETSYGDGDTTIVSSSTSTDKDTYNVESLAISPNSVTAVQVTAISRTPTGVPANLKMITKVSTNEQQSGNTSVSQSDTTYYGTSHIFETNPTAGSWSTSDITNLKIGYELA